jgi:NDP-sugar pyrophosphorylase family protein
MKLTDLFDISSFEHRSLFDKSVNLWDPLVFLSDYIKGFIKTSSRKEDLYVGRNTKIDPRAKIVGPVVVGDNCEINDNTLIRGGVVIGNGCKIGHGSEVKHSIILNNTNIAHFNYVGDSIIGSQVNFSAGAITANFKHGSKNPKVNMVINGKKVNTNLDKLGALIGDAAKIGCNVVLEPGSIIGKNTTVYPLTEIVGTIENNKIVKHKQDIEVINKE